LTAVPLRMRRLSRLMAPIERTMASQASAKTRVARVNLTGNTRHGLRVSTRLAKNTQVAFQNSRFLLRGRYGSDAAKLNLSQSGVTVSSKTPIGTLNWVRPARSSAKIAGLQFRGQKALTLHAIYPVFAVFAGILWLLGRLLRGLGSLTDAGDLTPLAGEHLGRGVEAKPAVMVLMVVPGEIVLAPAAGMVNGFEAPGVVGLVLERLELSFALGVVIADPGSTVAAGHAKLGQQVEVATGGKHWKLLE
jgi:hypothetical protein